MQQLLRIFYKVVINSGVLLDERILKIIKGCACANSVPDGCKCKANSD